MARKQSFTGADVSVTSSLAPNGLPGQIVHASTQPMIVKAVSDSTVNILPGMAVRITGSGDDGVIRVTQLHGFDNDYQFFGFVTRDTSGEPKNIDTQGLYFEEGETMSIMCGFGSIYIPLVIPTGDVQATGHIGSYIAMDGDIDQGEYNLGASNAQEEIAYSSYQHLRGLVTNDFIDPAVYTEDTTPAIVRVSFVQSQRRQITL